MQKNSRNVLSFIFLFVFVVLMAFLPTIVFASSASITVTVVTTQCSDGIDNDGDGKIDHPTDPGCDSVTDDNELDPTPPGGGGGGGGGVVVITDTAVQLSGRAYPLSQVIMLKDGQLALETIAGPDARFSGTIGDLTAGSYTFSVYSSDSVGRTSGLFTFSVTVTKGATTIISGIFLSPTIDVNKSEVKKGDNIAIFGQSVPNGTVTISVNSEHEIFRFVETDEDGIYLLDFDTSVLELATHHTKSKSAVETQVSSFGKTIAFKVGTRNVLKEPGDVIEFLRGDLNLDGRVNLIDFSIGAFWYKRELNAQITLRDIQVLNGDGKIDLIDFSIMAFNWTG